MTINASDILAVTTSVTKKWTKQRKAEERGNRSRSSRQYVYSNRVACTDVADQILPDAYEHASGNRTIENTSQAAIESAKAATIPKTLRRQLRESMQVSPDAWDKVLYAMANSRLSDADKHS